MVKCNSDILLGDYRYPYVCETQIESSWKNLTTTCAIQLPKTTTDRKANNPAQKIITVGNEAIVSFGYDSRVLERFRGYISEIKPGMPMDFKCEDEMWQLKRREVQNKSWRNGVRVADVLQYLGFAPTDYELIGNGSVDIEGDFSLRDCVNAAQALNHLKDALPLAFFFREGKLIVGDPYKYQNPNRVNFAFGYNIVSHSLEYKNAEDVLIQVEAISKHDTGKDVKVVIGDKGGERHTFHVGMNQNEAQVRKIAEENLWRFKWSGWRGSFQAFGEPIVRHGEIVVLHDKTNEITGSYWVDKVVTTSGTGGIRQNITIGRKV
jgi:hypothetical protein